MPPDRVPPLPPMLLSQVLQQPLLPLLPLHPVPPPLGVLLTQFLPMLAGRPTSRARGTAVELHE